MPGASPTPVLHAEQPTYRRNSNRRWNVISSQSLTSRPSVLLVLLCIFTVSGNAAAASTTNRQATNRRIGRIATSQSLNPQRGLAFTVLPQVQILVDGWVEYNPITCTEISTGSWTVTTAPIYGVTATGIVSGYLGNGDCPGVPFLFAVIYYTWTSSNPNATNDYFEANWSTPDGDFYVDDTVNITLASVIIQSADLVNNNVAITINGPTGTTASLTVNVKGANNTYTLKYDNGNPVGSGQYNAALTRPQMVQDVYSSIEADWNAGTPPVKGTFRLPTPWKVRGRVWNTVYIAVDEHACSGGPANGYWTFNWQTCVFTPIQLKPDFASQTVINGSGQTMGGTLVHTNFLGYRKDGTCIANKCVPQLPSGADGCNTFYTINSITGSCGPGLQNGDVAVFPSPVSGGGPYFCNDDLLYVDGGTNQNTYYPQIVEDTCPGCDKSKKPYPSPLEKDHVDNYYGQGKCYLSSLPDYWEADLGSGGEQVHVSQSITETAPPKLPSYHDDKVTVESWLDKDKFVVLSITSDHGRKDVPLPHSIFQVQEIRRYADRLIVVGEIGSGQSQVVIINLNNSTISGTFLATDTAISPDGRFIAFTSWFPSHGWNDPTIAPNDRAMLYDMTKSALQNRPAGVKPDNDEDVGFNVYPGGNKDSGYSAPVQLANAVVGRLSWSPDSTKLVFADQAQSSMKLVLVKVPGANTGAAPSISTLSLDKAGLCPAAPWPNYYCDAYMDQVKFLENGLDTFFSKVGSAVHRELRVKYADFVASR